MRFATSTLVASLLLTLVVGCGGEDEEGPPPAMPPPPPQGAPTDVVQAMPPSMSTNTSSGPNAVSASAASSAQSAPTASPSETSGATTGPLPALPNETPPAAPATAPTVTVVEAAPPQTTWVYQYPTGQWVYMADYGWVWVPAGAEQVDEEGVPYVYLYTPRWGWTWYVSPWGPGPYHYGIWVRHPWHPYGWRGGWVAHPHVIVHIHEGWHGGYHGYHGHHR